MATKLLTTAEVARQLGVSKSTIHRIARGTGKRHRRIPPTLSNSAGDLFSQAQVEKIAAELGKSSASRDPEPVNA